MKDLILAFALMGTMWTVFIGLILMEGINRVVRAIEKRNKP